MELCGEGEAEPPAGSMRVRLMRHQRLALHWMRAREASAANPRGGILADDQARPNPVVCHPLPDCAITLALSQRLPPVKQHSGFVKFPLPLSSGCLCSGLI